MLQHADRQAGSDGGRPASQRGRCAVRAAAACVPMLASYSRCRRPRLRTSRKQPNRAGASRAKPYTCARAGCRVPRCRLPAGLVVPILSGGARATTRARRERRTTSGSSQKKPHGQGGTRESVRVRRRTLDPTTRKARSGQTRRGKRTGVVVAFAGATGGVPFFLGRWALGRWRGRGPSRGRWLVASPDAFVVCTTAPPVSGNHRTRRRARPQTGS